LAPSSKVKPSDFRGLGYAVKVLLGKAKRAGKLVSEKLLGGVKHTERSA
jgi:hypothetical protein